MKGKIQKVMFVAALATMVSINVFAGGIQAAKPLPKPWYERAWDAFCGAMAQCGFLAKSDAKTAQYQSGVELA